MKPLIEYSFDKYATEDGWGMQREYGYTPNDNPVGGRWVLRNPQGEIFDFDRYRNDLAERNDMQLAKGTVKPPPFDIKDHLRDDLPEDRYCTRCGAGLFVDMPPGICYTCKGEIERGVR